MQLAVARQEWMQDTVANIVWSYEWILEQFDTGIKSKPRKFNAVHMLICVFTPKQV